MAAYKLWVCVEGSLTALHAHDKKESQVIEIENSSWAEMMMHYCMDMMNTDVVDLLTTSPFFPPEKNLFWEARTDPARAGLEFCKLGLPSTPATKSL